MMIHSNLSFFKKQYFLTKGKGRLLLRGILSRLRSTREEEISLIRIRSTHRIAIYIFLLIGTSNIEFITHRYLL